MKVLIANIGCDDTTETIMEINKKELEFLIKFSKENNKNSTYQCQPSISVYTEFEECLDDEGNISYYRYYDYKDLAEEGVK